MMGRVSIGRLMMAVGLTALGLGVFRGWYGEANVLSYLAPVAMLVILALIAACLAGGGVRRFSVGMAASLALFGVAAMVAPSAVLQPPFDRLIMPVVYWLDPPLPLVGTTSWDRMLVESDRIGYPEFDVYPGPCESVVDRELYFSHSRYLQSLLAVPFLMLAGIGGLLFARLRPGPPPTSSPPDSP